MPRLQVDPLENMMFKTFGAATDRVSVLWQAKEEGGRIVQWVP